MSRARWEMSRVDSTGVEFTGYPIRFGSLDEVIEHALHGGGDMTLTIQRQSPRVGWCYEIRCGMGFYYVNRIETESPQ